MWGGARARTGAVRVGWQITKIVQLGSELEANQAWELTSIRHGNQSEACRMEKAKSEIKEFLRVEPRSWIQEAMDWVMGSQDKKRFTFTFKTDLSQQARNPLAVSNYR